MQDFIIAITIFLINKNAKKTVVADKIEVDFVVKQTKYN